MLQRQEILNEIQTRKESVKLETKILREQRKCSESSPEPSEKRFSLNRYVSLFCC